MSRSVYDSFRLARAYACSRPPVHGPVINRLQKRLLELGWVNDPAHVRALDIGCGAGLSTAALAPLATTQRVGLEPVRTMLTYRGDVAPEARFVVGQAEHLPFASGCFDLIAAAGSLNYVDSNLFLPEAARVMASGGALIIYDFSSGRRLRGDPRLEDWFDSFERRYPFPPGYEMDLTRLPCERAGLRIETLDRFEVSVSMTADAYIAYVLGETNVELAISNGDEERAIAGWCRHTVEPLLPWPADVVFEAYIAIVRPAISSRS